MTCKVCPPRGDGPPPFAKLSEGVGNYTSPGPLVRHANPPAAFPHRRARRVNCTSACPACKPGADAAANPTSAFSGSNAASP